MNYNIRGMNWDKNTCCQEVVFGNLGRTGSEISLRQDWISGKRLRCILRKKIRPKEQLVFDSAGNVKQ